MYCQIKEIHNIYIHDILIYVRIFMIYDVRYNVMNATKENNYPFKRHSMILASFEYDPSMAYQGD